jgi:hypothetical protein
MPPFGSCSVAACFVEPNDRDSLVQLPFGVIVLVNVSCLFGIDEF